MHYKKCLLVRLPYSHHRHVMACMPVGLGYLAAALRRAGIDYEIFDMMFHDQGLKSYDVADLLAKIRQYQPDLIGFSMMTFRYKAHYAVIQRVRAAFPRVTIAAGGPHLSTLREKVLEECPAINFGFILEGDVSLPDFCLGKPVGAVKGLLYRDNGRVVSTGEPEFIRELDALPFPRYEKFDLKMYHPQNAMFIITSRGCPHQCTYCPVKLSIGRLFRHSSAESLVDEIAYWHNIGIRHFMLWDDNFTYIKKRVMDFCDQLSAAGITDCRFQIPNGIRADRVDREMLERMKTVGFFQISFGVESASNKVLRFLKKGETVEQIEQAIKDAVDLGYEVTLYFILGSPTETMQDAQMSFNLALKYPVAEARFYKLIPFPGTELFDWVRARNLFARPPEVYLNDADHFGAEPCFVTEELSYRDRVRLFKRGLQVSRQIVFNRKKRYFARLGILGKMIAYASSTPLYYYILRKLPFARDLILKARRLVYAHSGSEKSMSN